jgi:uncharacterized protein (TIRG00374 family)
MKGKLSIFTAIGIIIFVIILTQINIQNLIKIFENVNIILLSIAVSVNFVASFLKAFKWKIIVNSFNKDFALAEAIKLFFIGFAFSAITPAKVGDFIKVFYINDDGFGPGKALSTIVIDRLVDVVLLVSIAVIGITAFSIIFRIRILSFSLIILIIAAVAAGVYVLFNKKLVSKLLRPFFNIFIPANLKNRFSEYYHDFFIGFFDFFKKKVPLFSVIAIGIVSWIIPFVYAYILGLSIGIDVPLSYFVLIIPIISLLDLLPISISGIGTRDAALIFLFGLQGISPEQAIAFSLLYLFLSYWLIALIGVGFWLKNPIKFEIPAS